MICRPSQQHPLGWHLGSCKMVAASHLQANRSIKDGPKLDCKVQTLATPRKLQLIKRSRGHPATSRAVEEKAHQIVRMSPVPITRLCELFIIRLSSYSAAIFLKLLMRGKDRNHRRFKPIKLREAYHLNKPGPNVSCRLSEICSSIKRGNSPSVTSFGQSSMEKI